MVFIYHLQVTLGIVPPTLSLSPPHLIILNVDFITTFSVVLLTHFSYTLAEFALVFDLP